MAEPPTISTEALNEEFLTESLPVGWPWRLLVFSVVFFSLSLLSYFGLRIGYRSYLESESKRYDGELAKLSTTVSSDQREEFTSFYSQVFNLRSVLERHPFSSNAFRYVEKHTINAVYFTSAQVHVADAKLTLQGVATGFDAIAQQLSIFNKAPNVVRVSLSQVGLQGDAVNFTVEITFTLDFFRRPVI